jgi:hypothetical protein
MAGELGRGRTWIDSQIQEFSELAETYFLG